MLTNFELINVRSLDPDSYEVTIKVRVEGCEGIDDAEVEVRKMWAEPRPVVLNPEIN